MSRAEKSALVFSTPRGTQSVSYSFQGLFLKTDFVPGKYSGSHSKLQPSEQ